MDHVLHKNDFYNEEVFEEICKAWDLPKQTSEIRIIASCVEAEEFICKGCTDPIGQEEAQNDELCLTCKELRESK